MKRFAIEYYCAKYHTGGVNYDKTRTGVVFAKDKEEAISKVRLADNDYIGIKNMTFEEIMQGGDYVENIEKHECCIGVLHDYEATRLVTLEELKENIKNEKQLAENTDIGWLKAMCSKYTIVDYCDKRKSTDLTRFNYCPICGKKIDWKAIKKGGAE